MKKVRKVYAVFGMLAWKCVIVSGKVQFPISFEDGMYNIDGETPATFETSNPVLQYAIEHSEYFKSKKIVLYKTYELGDNGKHAENKVSQEATKEPVKAESQELSEVNVPDINEAKQYLHENFGIPLVQMRSKDSILNFAKVNKISFVGLD